MRHSRFCCGLFRWAAVALVVVAFFVSLAPAQEKLVPIFDGRTLDGWEVCNGFAPYHVEDGVIVGTTAEGSPNSFLCTKREYGDFILEFEVKVDPLLNSGVQVRSHRYAAEETVMTLGNEGRVRRKQPAGRVYGYQVEISNEKSGASGGIYDEARRGWVDNTSTNPAARAALKDNEWNHYRIVARGDSVKTWVNGVPCADLVDPLDLSGFIGLQVHSYKGERPAQVRWRNIRIQDLGRHEWRPLWDGKTLNNWNKVGAGSWSIEEGSLRGVNRADVKEGGFLLSAQRYTDFTVRLKFKALKGNSGLFIRMERREGGMPSGTVMQAEIDALRDVGGLYESGGRRWVVQPDPKLVEQSFLPGEWNEMAVSAHGGRIVVHVNGFKTADVKDDPGRREGHLALQVHGGQDVEVLFKDIEILTPVGR